MTLINKTFKLTFLFIFLAEALSFLGYLRPTINHLGFFLIALIALIISLYRLEYGLWLVLAELFIGSKGYLFYLDYGGINLSLRVALWLIVLAVWFGQTVYKISKEKSFKIFRDEFSFKTRGGVNKFFALLFLFIGWGLLNGFLNRNDFNNIFFDFNAWLYFLLLFPAYRVIKSEASVKNLLSIFLAAVFWLSLKSLFLLFVFSHDVGAVLPKVYRWVRTSGVGEITKFRGGFYRIFLQSHIYNLIGFFVFSLWLVKKITADKISSLRRDKSFWLIFAAATLSLTIVLISFSRSFWIGLGAGLLLLLGYLIYLLRQETASAATDGPGAKIKATLGLFLASLILSVAFLALVLNFPYPRPWGGFITAELFSERFTQIDEAAISSRWELLPPLWAEIKEAPLLGQGFGATVTYRSKDPRILALNSAGEYTTYAFEWGWLDVWLKLSLFGLAIYLILLGKIIRGLINKSKESETPELYLALALGLTVIIIVNFFTPYFNHPLGIGFLILTAALLAAEPLRKF